MLIQLKIYHPKLKHSIWRIELKFSDDDCKTYWKNTVRENLLNTFGGMVDLDFQEMWEVRLKIRILCHVKKRQKIFKIKMLVILKSNVGQGGFQKMK